MSGSVQCLRRLRADVWQAVPIAAVVWTAAAAVWLAAAPAAGGGEAATLNGFEVGNASVPSQAIRRGGPPRDGIPAIDRPRFVAASRAGLAEDDRVLGLADRGVARAYPIRILNWHEVVNDRIEGRRVLITYCPLCGTGMAFDGRIGALDTTFGVSGLLYNSDVLLYDRATQSLWSQLLRAAVSGPMKGTRLRQIPLSHTTWGDWRARHPATQVLSTDTGAQRDYSIDPYAGYGRIPQLLFEVEHRDERFDPKEWVLGVELGGRYRAYPFSVLERSLNGSGVVRDTLGGVELRVRYDAVYRSAEALDAQGGPLPATMVYWFAWVAFHPDTDVYAKR